MLPEPVAPPPAAAQPWWWGLRLPVGIFAAWWSLYLTALWWGGGGELAPYRNFTWWPSAWYLTVAQPGITLQVFAHFMITFVGGTFVGMVVYLPFRWLGRDESEWQTRAALATYWLVALYGFAVVRGVPRQVTTYDAAAQTLTLRRFAPLTFAPEAPVRVDIRKLRAISTKVGRYASWRRDSDTVARLFAHLDDGTLHQLGSRDCRIQSPAACLESTNRDVHALLLALGLPTQTTMTTDEASVSRVFVIRRP